MRKSIILILGVLFTTVLFAASTQNNNPEPQKSIFDVLNYQEVMEITLEFEVDKMLSNRRSEDEFAGTMTFEDQTGEKQTWKTKINMRGRFRRTRCTEMPPLKLNFKKGALKDAGLAKFDDFKLVTQCIQDASSAKEYLIKEYLAYKMFNHLTDYSFRVQMLKINFVDKTTGEKRKQWGFLIEDTAQMRARVGAEKHDQIFKIEKDQIDSKSLKITSLFEYMIGNLDWDVKQRFHNMKPISKDGKVIPVPYDFDFSGLVAASYATVNPNFAVKSMQDRLYLGYAEDLEDSEEIIQLFKDKKEAMIDEIKDCKKLRREVRLEMIRYINSFYKGIEDIKLPAELEDSSLTSKS